MSQKKDQYKLIVLLGMLGLALVFVLLRYSEHGGVEKKEIKYRLKWLANTGFVGDLYAGTYGLYINEGLNVVVKAGGPELDAIRELQTGETQFGVASADQVIRALAEKADVVVIAQIYQKNPVRWIYRSKEITINDPCDLKSKTVGITYGDNDETIMKALLHKYNISEKEVVLKGVRYDFTPFTKKEVSLFPVYWNTQGVELENQLSEEKEEAGFFDPDKYGIHFVANSIVTTSEMLKNNRSEVIRFLRAIIKGWEAALDIKNEDLAVQAMLKNLELESTEKTINLSPTIRKQLKVTRELVEPNDPRLRIGTINIDGWKQTAEIMFEQKLIPTKVNIELCLHPELLTSMKQ